MLETMAAGAYLINASRGPLVDEAALHQALVEGQIAGAGLGGCAMVLVRAEDEPRLRSNLLREFYEANDLPPGIIQCAPSAGSGVVSIASA